MMTRDFTLDCMKGIAMLAVIGGHCCTFDTPLYHVIYAFHMPLFFILSGYFYRQKPILQSLKNDFIRLVCPAYVVMMVVVGFVFATKGFTYTNLVRWIISIAYGLCDRATIGPMHVEGLGAMWFLLSLFVCKNVYNVLHTYIVDVRLRVAINVILSIVAVLVWHCVLPLPFALCTGLQALLFYEVGQLIRSNGGFDSISCKWIIPLVLCYVASILLSRMDMATCYYRFYPLDVLGGIGGSLALFWFCKWCFVKIPVLKQIIVWFGTSTLSILCYHKLIIFFHPYIPIHDHVLWFLTNVGICSVLVLIVNGVKCLISSNNATK
ncbi:MAG: acyltransferase family protein [Paludibacteraceae bacterium]|nr:acyltransferase family protein [Paludibacteraceae bacterium]